MTKCITCGREFNSGPFSASLDCPACERQEQELRDAKRFREESLRVSRENEAARYEQAQSLHRENAEAAERWQRESEQRQRESEQRQREFEEDAKRRSEEAEEREWARQVAEDERESERQRHAEKLAAEKKAYLDDIAERQRQALHFQTLRQSVFGKARDFLEIAIGQRQHDPKSAETALHSAIACWPGYAWAWLELAELLVAQGRPAAEVIQRAATEAKTSGVCKLAPDSLPVELAEFAQSNLRVALEKSEFHHAHQARFLARFARVAPPTLVKTLIEGSSVFYPILFGPPEGWMDLDYDVSIGTTRVSIAQSDQVTMLFLISRSTEVLTWFVEHGASLPLVSKSVAQKSIIGRLGTDALLFEWCAVRRAEHVALKWLHLILSVRLPDPRGAVAEIFVEMPSMATDFSKAMAIPIPQRAAALRDVEVKFRAMENVARWDMLVDSMLVDRRRILDEVLSAVPNRMNALRDAVLDRVESEWAARSAAVSEGQRRYQMWQDSLEQLHAAWKEAQLQVLTSIPVSAKPIAPPPGAYSLAAFREWRRLIDVAIESCNPRELVQYNDRELDGAVLAHRSEELRLSLQVTQELINEHIRRFEESERLELKAMAVEAAAPSGLGVALAFGLAVIGLLTAAALWGRLEMIIGIGIAVVGSVIVYLKQRSVESEIVLSVEQEAQELDEQVRSIMSTPGEKAAHVAALLKIVSPRS